MATFDVVLKGGRVLDPAQGIDATLDIGTKHGRIAALEEDIPADDASARARRRRSLRYAGSH